MVLSEVRFSLMSMDQLLDIVRPNPISDSDRLLDAIQEQGTSKNIRYRGALCKYDEIFESQKHSKWICVFISGPEKNIATAKYNSKTICGEGDQSALLNGNVTKYDGTFNISLRG